MASDALPRERAVASAAHEQKHLRSDLHPQEKSRPRGRLKSEGNPRKTRSQCRLSRRADQRERKDGVNGSAPFARGEHPLPICRAAEHAATDISPGVR